MMKSLMKKLLFLIIIANLLFISADVAMGAFVLTKTANPTSVSFGDTITYTYGLSNTGPTDLHNVVINDNKLGAIAVGNLSVGGSWSQPLTHKVGESDMPGPLRNTARATGLNATNGTVTSNSVTRSVTLDILDSCLLQWCLVLLMCE